LFGPDSRRLVVESALEMRLCDLYDGSLFPRGAAVKTASPSRCRSRSRRAGAASLDHILVLAVTLPVLTIVIPVGERILRAVWEMSCVEVSWPFL
jgi:hypothetical protein